MYEYHIKSTFATCCLDHSWTKSTKRSCQKENDEAGERNIQTSIGNTFLIFITLPVFWSFRFLPPSKTRLEMQKALEQDSTVYDYDGVYDEIQKQRLEKTQKTLHGTDKRVIPCLRSSSIAFGDECRRIPVKSHFEWSHFSLSECCCVFNFKTSINCPHVCGLPGF